METNKKRNAQISDIIYVVLNMGGSLLFEDKNTEIVLCGVNSKETDSLTYWHEIEDMVVESIHKKICEQYPSALKRDCYVLCEEYRSHRCDDGTDVISVHLDEGAAKARLDSTFNDRKDAYSSEFDEDCLEITEKSETCKSVIYGEYEDYSTVYIKQVQLMYGDCTEDKADDTDE